MNEKQKIAIYLASAALLFAGGCAKEANRASTEVTRGASELKPVSGAPAFSDFAAAPKPDVTPALVARGKTLYAQNCVACHGLKGDGKGDAAAFLTPKPRDFTKANYRLRSTPPNKLPTDLDLFREVSLGLPGTPMPPWRYMLSNEDRWALVEYLKSLSPRFADTNEDRVALGDFGTPPLKSAASIAEGQQLYAKMNCFSCHGESGRGDGPSASTLLDDSGTKIKPRDFSNPSTFKGGYDSREIVRAILTGFNGTPMIGFAGAMTKEDAWKLAYYIETFARPAAGGTVNRRSQSFFHAKNSARRTCGSN